MGTSISSKQISFPQMIKVYELFRQKGVTSEILQKELLGQGILSDVIEANARSTIPSRSIFQQELYIAEWLINTYHNLSFQKLIEMGHYLYVNSKIMEISEENFSTSKEKQKELRVELPLFNRNLDSEEVKVRLDKMGLRPGTLKELIIFAAEFPEIVRSACEIVALGSPFVIEDSDQNNFPYLIMESSSPDSLVLNLETGSLFQHGQHWSEHTQFLAFKKEEAEE